MDEINVGYLAELLERLDKAPIHEIMRADEQARGNTVVVPGEVDWLPVEDWHETVVVSQADREVRLIAILAKRPGEGAFRRLVDAIRRAGLTPVVVAPSLEMRATLRRWGWRQRNVGGGWDQEEQWLPRKAGRQHDPHR